MYVYKDVDFIKIFNIEKEFPLNPKTTLKLLVNLDNSMKLLKI